MRTLNPEAADGVRSALGSPLRTGKDRVPNRGGSVSDLPNFVIPVLLGDGVPFSPPGATPQELHLESHTVFPNGAVKLVYTPTESNVA